MRWIKASERLPESTRGYAIQIATRWTFDDGNIQLRTTTTNELIDIAKNLIDKHKIEWLDEGQSDSDAERKFSLEEALQIYEAGYNNNGRPLGEFYEDKWVSTNKEYQQQYFKEKFNIDLP